MQVAGPSPCPAPAGSAGVVAVLVAVPALGARRVGQIRTAIGVLADVDSLSAELLERESAPRTRKPLTELLLVND